MKAKYLIVIIAFFIVSASAVFAWSKHNAETKNEEKGENDSLIAPKLDPQLLARFVAACEQFDPNKKEFLIVAKMKVTDGADSTNNINSAPYIFSKKDGDYYFKLGQTESINANGSYIFLDHKLKKVMVSAQQSIVPGMGMPNVSQLLENLNGEFYALSERVDGDVEKISLLNETHVSCKEFSVSLDPASQKLKTVLLRLSNEANPEDKKKDKKIELQISQLDEQSKLENYVSKQVVKKENGTWVLQSAYKTYNLIIL